MVDAVTDAQPSSPPTESQAPVHDPPAHDPAWHEPSWHEPPRIAPLTESAATEAQLEALEPLGGMESLHLFRTLVHHPKLFRRWLPFAGRLLQASTLSPRSRQLVILRTAALCGSDYEWGQHVALGRDAGLSDDEIIGCSVPTEPGVWSAEDLAVLTATEELVDGHRMAPATWDELVLAGWSDEQLLEVTMLAGHYAMLAGMLRSVGVQPEGPIARIGSVEPDADDLADDAAGGSRRVAEAGMES